MINNRLQLSKLSNQSQSSQSSLPKSITSPINNNAISIRSKSKFKEESLAKPQKEHIFIRAKSTNKLQEDNKKKSMNKGIIKPEQPQRQKSKQKFKQNIRSNGQKSKSKSKSKQKETQKIKQSSIKAVKDRVKHPIKKQKSIPKVNEKSFYSTLTSTACKTNIHNETPNKKSPRQRKLKSIKKPEVSLISRQPSVKKLVQHLSSNKKNMNSSLKSKNIDESIQITHNDQSFLKYIPPEIVKQHKKVKFQDFVILRSIAEESYYKEYLTINKVTRCLFNIRVLNKRQIIELEMQKQLEESIKIHYLLSDIIYKQIQKIYTIFDDPIHIYIILEPLLPNQIHLKHEKGLRQEDKAAKQAQICFLFQNILQVVQEIHRKDIVLRNLSFSSIKIFMGSIYLTILSRAACLKSKRFRNSFFGNVKQTPHEVLIYKTYDFSYDMWSLGILLYQLSTGLHPFSGPHQIQAIKSLEFPIPMLISNKLVKLISSLLIESQNRLTIDQCLKHELINHQFMNKHLIFRDIWSFLSQ